ncbi:TPA: aminopeptidase P family protein [archaeon]|jgi:Xaa-Pro dipeptidase|uniref:Aminopeptidase P family protein n=1 Tax=Candidatus Undinarchaeum marinum TaxID=2756141 RepID=A0A832V0C6_9ARCH|nr:aminopeptidase P family protein [Candidatus Undinarchaeum marinum]
MIGKEQTERALGIFDEQGIDSLFLMNIQAKDPFFYYFTGASGFESSLVLIGEEPVIYTPGFEMERASEESWIKDVREFSTKNTLKDIKKIVGNNIVGVNWKFLPLRMQEKLQKAGIKTKDVSEALLDLRQYKTKEELGLIEKAVKATKQIIEKIDTSLPGNEIRAELLSQYAMKDMDEFYRAIVAYDADSAVPHYRGVSKPGKQCLLVDTGGSYKGYGADITRTFLLEPEKELKEIYSIVEEAQKAAIVLIEPGARISDISKVADDIIEKAGYKMVHSLGHGIGLEVHERPNIRTGSDEVLEENMVFTLEPAIYIKGKYGVRIEDNILVTKKGCKIL